MTTTLGLDLGPNSIGWALIDQDAGQIINTGVRIFPEGVDKFDTTKEESRSEKRRIARGMRRQTQRRALRKRYLRQALMETGLWPTDPTQQQALEECKDNLCKDKECNPYALRAKALDEKLTPHEIGRVLLHLNQRRGFKSNRKKDRQDSEVKGMLGEINELAAAIKDDPKIRTLGEYLYQKYKDLNHAQRIENDHLRSRHTQRDMLEDEFEKIWSTQATYHPALLTDDLKYGRLGKQKYPQPPMAKKAVLKQDADQKRSDSDLKDYGIHGLIFRQRTMYWPTSVIGLCELEPKQKRCPKADRHAQRCRLVQEVNNLRYIDPDSRDEKKLTDEQRALLLDQLSQKEKMTFDQIRKALGFTDSVKFNLEKGKKPTLKGITTDWLAAKAVGKQWHQQPQEQKDAVIHLILETQHDEDATEDKLISTYGYSQEQANKLLCASFPEGYTHLSRKAIDKILPFLEQGMPYMGEDESNSALHAAGYLRRDELQRRIFDKLPDPARTNLRDCRIGDIPNPVVKRALVELRKVVNTIIREYGKPDAVHVEMARSVQMSGEKRKEYNKRIRDREAVRDGAANILRDLRHRGLAVSLRRDIPIYLFWEEQAHECIYCQQPISQEQLFSGEIDVDHILPYSKTLDNSQGNKVVCHRACNAQKGQRTPYEWLAAAEPARYERICQHASSLMHRGLMPYGKYRKFLLKELDSDQFIARQLVDTGYITRTTAEYLKCLFENDHQVLGLKGQLTSELRQQWGLNSVLRHDDLDLKNREDHRHHAVDAIILALTDRSRLGQLTKIRKSGYFDRQTGEVYELPLPWENFREDVIEKINAINISHRSQRKVSGGLHEETLYGPTPTPGIFVVRKPLEMLSANEVPLIRDDGIRKIVERRLASHGIEIGRGKKTDKKKWKEALANVVMPSGVPIKKVRVLRKEQTIQPIRQGQPGEAFVKPGSTHHLCIFEWEEQGKTKRDAVFVTMLEAINRVKNKQTIIQRTHPDRPNAKFVMSLSRGEMVLANWKGQEKLLILKTSISTNNRLIFALHTDARKSDEMQKIAFSPIGYGTLQKVTVDPLGRIRFAEEFKPTKKDCPVDPRITQLAEQLNNRKITKMTNRRAREILKELGLTHLGGQLTSERHRLQKKISQA